MLRFTLFLLFFIFNLLTFTKVNACCGYCEDSDDDVPAVTTGSKLNPLTTANMHPSNVRVLIVEDNEVCAMTLQQFCAAPGLFKMDNIKVAPNGQVGIEAFGSHKPHIVFVDRNMPEKDGIVVVREIRAMQDYVGVIPTIICISEDSTPACVEEFERVGANAFFHKPFNLPHFKAVIAKYFTSTQARSCEPQAAGAEH